MKKYFGFLIALILAMADLSAGTADNDTVWTKNIWPENVSGVMFSPDGSKVYVSTNKRVWVINTLTGDSIRTVYGTGGFNHYSTDGKFIYTSSLRKLDVQTFNVVGKYDTIPANGFNISDVSLSGDGNRIIVISSYMHWDSIPPYAHFYDNIATFNSDNMKFQKLTTYPEQMFNVASSPDGKYLITCSRNCSQWWPRGFETGCQYKVELWDALSVQPIKTIYLDTISPGEIKFTPDSKYFTAVIGGHICFFDLTTFQIIKKSNLLVSNYKFTNDNKYMVIGGGGTSKSKIPKTIIWDLLNDKSIYEYSIYDSVNDIYYSTGETDIDVSTNKNYIISSAGFYLSLLNGKFDDTAIKDFDNQNSVMVINPNPNNGEAVIEFNCQLSGNYNLDIYNVNGLIIQNLYSGYINNGVNRYLWKSNDYPNGTYFCKIIGNGLNLMYKIIVAK